MDDPYYVKSGHQHYKTMAITESSHTIEHLLATGHNRAAHAMRDEVDVMDELEHLTKEELLELRNSLAVLDENIPYLRAWAWEALGKKG